MSGTITCSSFSTSSISTNDGTGTIQIGPFIWPTTTTPSDGAVLKTDASGNLEFATVNLRTPLGVTDTTYTITTDDDIVAITGTNATTLTLPDPTTKTVGDLIYVVKEVAGSSIITVVPNGSELISGASSVTLTSSYGSMKIYTNGINWFSLF